MSHPKTHDARPFPHAPSSEPEPVTARAAKILRFPTDGANDADGLFMEPEAREATAMQARLDELLGQVDAANRERELLWDLVVELADELDAVRAQRDRLAAIGRRWESHLAEVEVWVDAQREYYEARSAAQDQALVRALHVRDEALELCDELVGRQRFVRRWKREALRGRIETLREG